MANMNDVAKLAGVSRGTVSNYINNVKVKEKSRIKIEAAIKELGYIPNVAARELKTNTASNVVFIVPSVWNPFFSELTYYLQLELKKIGKKLLLCNSENDYKSEIEYIEMAKQNKVYGIISISYSNILPYLNDNLPYVAIERYYNDAIPYVTSDNFNGSKLAVRELHKRGCKHILHITRKVEVNAALTDRRNGFEEECQILNVEYVIFDCECQSEDFRDKVNEYLHDAYDKGIHFDGITCGTDRYAQYVLEILNDLHLQVPQDIQVIGFDGVKSYPNERLTISTIKQDVKKLAEEAVQMLACVHEKKAVTSKVLPTSFLQLRTTKES